VFLPTVTCLRVDCYSPNIVVVGTGTLWFICGAGKEDHFGGVVGSKYDKELGVIDPSSLPINFRLDSSEPWVS
jgi:hypothetical protein